VKYKYEVWWEGKLLHKRTSPREYPFAFIITTTDKAGQPRAYLGGYSSRRDLADRAGASHVAGATRYQKVAHQHHVVETKRIEIAERVRRNWLVTMPDGITATRWDSRNVTAAIICTSEDPRFPGWYLKQLFVTRAAADKEAQAMRESDEKLKALYQEKYHTAIVTRKEIVVVDAVVVPDPQEDPE
jgi:hypothetical protein